MRRSSRLLRMLLTMQPTGTAQLLSPVSSPVGVLMSNLPTAPSFP